MPKVRYQRAKGLYQESGEDLVIEGAFSSNHLRFMTGDYNGMTISTKNDAAIDSGVNASSGDLIETVYDGDGAGSIVLPSATYDALVVVRLDAIADGTANLVFTMAAGDNFEAQTISLPTIGAGAGAFGPRSFGGPTTTSDAARCTLTTSHNTLTIACTATNNQTNIGAEIAFYCATKGAWRVSFRGVALGTGVANATFAGS
jgi:hypothetical protein